MTVKKQCIMMTPSWRVPPQYCCLRRRKARIRRITQVEKVLKITNRNQKYAYVPPLQSLKLIYYASVNLQSKRGRRLGIPTPVYFLQLLDQEDRENRIAENRKIAVSNFEKAKHSRLKRRRFYLHAKTSAWKRWRRIMRDARRPWHE